MAQQKAADKAVAAKTEQAKDKPQNAKSAGRERRAVVQAGAFRDPNAAKQAQQKIKSLNYAAAIEEVSTASKPAFSPAAPKPPPPPPSSKRTGWAASYWSRNSP